MKKENLALYVLRLTVTLLIIAAVVAAALAVVNQITAPVIQKAKEEKTRNAIMTVLPGVHEVQEIPFTDNTGMVTKVYRANMSHPEDGVIRFSYAVEVTPSGFDGEITLMVGVDQEGKVLGISVISHTETAGLGAVAGANTAAGEAFRQQFIGQSGHVQVKKDGGVIDAITGATVTSRAICSGINAALDCVAALGGA